MKKKERKNLLTAMVTTLCVFMFIGGFLVVDINTRAVGADSRDIVTEKIEAFKSINLSNAVLLIPAYVRIAYDAYVRLNGVIRDMVERLFKMTTDPKSTFGDAEFV